MMVALMIGDGCQQQNQAGKSPFALELVSLVNCNERTGCVCVCWCLFYHRKGNYVRLRIIAHAQRIPIHQ